MDDNFCPCGALFINGKCSRRHPIKACKGEVANLRPKRISGKSSFWEYKDKDDFSQVGYAGK